MKEEFKNRWLEFLIITVVAILSMVYSFNESNPVDARIDSAFFAGACMWGICDFFGRHTAKYFENFLKKKKDEKRVMSENFDINKIIEENNIQDLRSLLQLLGNPDIFYQVYWLTKVVDTGEELYSDDWEYFFESSFKNGVYKELEKFEKEYYEIVFSKYDFIHFHKTKNILFYIEFKDDDPREYDEEDLPEDIEYMTRQEIMELIGKNE